MQLVPEVVHDAAGIWAPVVASRARATVELTA